MCQTSKRPLGIRTYPNILPWGFPFIRGIIQRKLLCVINKWYPNINLDETQSCSRKFLTICGILILLELKVTKIDCCKVFSAFFFQLSQLLVMSTDPNLNKTDLRMTRITDKSLGQVFICFTIDFDVEEYFSLLTTFIDSAFRCIV